MDLYFAQESAYEVDDHANDEDEWQQKVQCFCSRSSCEGPSCRVCVLDLIHSDGDEDDSDNHRDYQADPIPGLALCFRV